MSTATPWVELMSDALVMAKIENFDVFNALDLMENRYYLRIFISSVLRDRSRLFSIN